MKKITYAFCHVAMFASLAICLAAIDGAQSLGQLVAAVVLPGTLFACAAIGIKIINQLNN